MSKLQINNITNKVGDTGPVIAGISSVSTDAFMGMPSGSEHVRYVGSGRGVILGGNTSPAGTTNSMEYVTIASTGNAQDFGDLTVDRWSLGGASDSHGGLGGF